MATMRSVSYVASTRLDEKGRLTVPKEYREELGLTAGAPVAVLRLGSGLILLPEHKRFEELCDSIASALEKTGVPPSEVVAGLPAARLRVFRRRYGREPARRRARR